MDNKEIQLTLNEFIDMIYNYTLINSLVFSIDIEKFIHDNLKIDNFNTSILLKNFKNYLAINKDKNIFDDQIKDNCYFFINYISEIDNITEKSEKNSIINEMKINLNNTSYSNFDFLREQILLRDYGDSHYNRNKAKINKISDRILNDYKEIYYRSISNDFLVMSLLLIEEQKFYNEGYKLFLLCKDFYRSINYFIQNYNFLFKSLDWLNRIKFVMNKDLRLLTNVDDVSNLEFESEIDDEFLDIMEITQKLVKKIDKKNK